MELNITSFFNNASPEDYSASISELGQDAGVITWNASIDAFSEYLILDNTDKIGAFKKHIESFGAWEKEEIEGMGNVALNALCIQMISGDIRESGIDQKDPDWAKYESSDAAGNFFKGDDGEIYYSIEG